MKELLRFIHFRMFENTQLEKKFRSIHESETNAIVRNDERISNCMRIEKLLTEIEEQILMRLND